MKIINPEIIIPLSIWVANELNELQKRPDFFWKIGNRLNHPCYRIKDIKKYLDALLPIIEK